MTETMYVLRIYLMGERVPRAETKDKDKEKLEAIIDDSARRGGIWLGNEFVPMQRVHSATVKLDDGT